MEYWNIGILDKTKKNTFFLTHYSNIPSFQWFWFTVHRLKFIVSNRKTSVICLSIAVQSGKDIVNAEVSEHNSHKPYDG